MQKINTFDLTGIHTAKKINFLIKKREKRGTQRRQQDDREAKTQRDNEEEISYMTLKPIDPS